MKTIIRAHSILLIFCLFSASQLWGQQHFATIKKNYNVLAEGLKHDLNISRDTLVLKSENPILKVYTVGDFSGLIDLEVNDFQQSIPLQKLRKGKYVFVVDQPKLKIVFQVLVHRNGKDYRAISKRLASSDENVSTNKSRLTKKIKTESVVSAFQSQKPSDLISVNTAEIETGRSAKFKAYNLTDIERENVQSREDARRIQAYERQAKLKSQAIKSGSDKLEQPL